MIDFLSIIAVGFFLGMRHASDPDHVIAVTTIVTRQRNLTGTGPLPVWPASAGPVGSILWQSRCLSTNPAICYRYCARACRFCGGGTAGPYHDPRSPLGACLSAGFWSRDGGRHDADHYEHRFRIPICGKRPPEFFTPPWTCFRTNQPGLRTHARLPDRFWQRTL